MPTPVTGYAARSIAELERTVEELWTAYGNARTDAGAECIREEIREAQAALDAKRATQDACTLPRFAN